MRSALQENHSVKSVGNLLGVKVKESQKPVWSVYARDIKDLNPSGALGKEMEGRPAPRVVCDHRLTWCGQGETAVQGK